MNRSLSANACLSGGGNKRFTTEIGNYFAVNQGFVTNIASNGGVSGDKVHIYSIIVLFFVVNRCVSVCRGVDSGSDPK
jgi:uncharacterized membrane protein